MNEVRIEFVQEEFTKEGRFFFIDDGNWNIEGICSNANTEEDDLNGRKSKLKQENRDVPSESSTVLPEKSHSCCPVFTEGKRLLLSFGTTSFHDWRLESINDLTVDSVVVTVVDTDFLLINRNCWDIVVIVVVIDIVVGDCDLSGLEVLAWRN